MNTFGPHKASRRWTWHSPGGEHHNQIDYIMIKSRFHSSVNIAKTRSFPGADIGSDHELVMMAFALRLKKCRKPGNIRIKFDLEKLKDPTVLEAFQAHIGGKFAPLLALNNEDTDVDSLTDTFSTSLTETAGELLGKHRTKKKPWVTNNILDLCDKRRALKKKKKDKEAVEEYRIVNLQVKTCMKIARETWIDDQCKEIENSLNKNDSKRAYQITKDLTTSKQVRTSVIQNKDGKCLTEEKEIEKRWTEYCSELYSHSTAGDPTVLNVSQSQEMQKVA